jgi:hypothetical protein
MGGIATAAVLEADLQQRVVNLAEQLEAATETIDMLVEESAADIELAREDVGWQRIGAWSAQQFTRDGLNRSAQLCRIMASANPLVKRGLALRHAYVWGKGIEIEARDKNAPDLMDVVQAHIDGNLPVLFGSQAQEELENVFGTDGNIFLAHFTKPRTGKVKVRSFPFAEIVEKISNPDDRDEPWYYKRQWTAVEIDGNGRRESVRYVAYYPDINYRPRARPKEIDDIEVVWDAPILHACVNRRDGDDFGLGDAFAAIDFARAYTSFLNDWAKLMKALAKYAWKVTGESKKTAGTASTAIRTNTAATAGNIRKPGSVGDTAVMAGANLEAIPKSGATLDADSGRPLAAMVAAALGVPVTMLLADPGQTGARAVAETLDRPTVLQFKGRQRLWQSILTQSIDYAINQAVKAPAGPLRGTLGRDEWDAETVELAGDIDRTIEVTFPELDDINPKDLLEAVAIADGLDKIPDLVIVRAALMAIPGVTDIDQILEDLTDDDGNFIPPKVTAGQAAVDQFNRGEGLGGLSAGDEPTDD